MAWECIETRDVISAQRKRDWEESHGLGGKKKAKTYTRPLYAHPPAEQAAAPSPAAREGRQLGEARVNAARYEWLRQQPNDTSAPRIDVVYWMQEDEASNSGEGLRMEALDAAIDAARATSASN